jgi:acetate kinase
MGTRPGQIDTGVALNLIAERDMIAAQVHGIAGATRRMTLASSGLSVLAPLAFSA